MTCQNGHQWRSAVKSDECECWFQECAECSDFEELHECEVCYYARLQREDEEEYGSEKNDGGN